AHPLFWSDAEETNNNYWSGNLDNIIDEAQSNNLKLILRVSDAPGWAWEEIGDPPQWAGEFGDFVAWVAQHVKSRAPDLEVAYVIWNEPNLPNEWGWRAPQPSWMVALLQAAYDRIKAVDPDAVVIAPGMATTGGPFSGCGVNISTIEMGVSAVYTQKLLAADAVNDLEFICGIYEGGGQGYFDVLGTHPYGFAYEPETNPSSVNGLAFRRAEQQRAIMVAQGDGDKQMWAIEFGWIVDTRNCPGEGCSGPWTGRAWQIVTESQQADYLVRAYDYAYQNWPWMGVMTFFNLDFNIAPWYACCDPIRGYAITGNPAYDALKNMPKYTSGSISGYVLDNRGASFAGADVEILGLTSTTTDLSGGYEFTNVISGTYDLQASAVGYGTLQPRRGVRVNEGETLTDVNFYLPPPDNVVGNWDFESDLDSWAIGGSNLPAISNDAHTGYKSAHLGGAVAGDSWVEQSVAIPPDIYRPTLSFLYLYSSSDTGDQFRVEIRDAGGNLLDTPWSTASATSLWTHQWLDLSPYEGQTIRVRFLLSENGSNPSYLYLDEVSLGKASGGPYKGYLPLVHKGS
ncbi:MAG: carboxypeptidase regulatory-like domain-containing protein, partial [Anaerolineae bacterium]|nr:carboxypeptidase regulatory-like domain-containing protein [Anaerolineae bacterium]